LDWLHVAVTWIREQKLQCRRQERMQTDQIDLQSKWLALYS
jgi:hypothetical protein